MDLLTTTQVAKELGVSKVRVNQLIHLGRLPAQRFGERWAIKPADLAAFKKMKREAGRPAKYVVMHKKRSWEVSAQGSAEARDKVIQELGEAAPPRSELKVSRRRKPKRSKK